MANEKKVAREPSFLLALIPIVAMIGFMLYCFLGHSESGYHDAHMPLVMSIVVACIVGHFCGHDFKDMLSGMIERLSASMEAVLILCTVGFLVSSFMASGAIPSLIVYGLDLLTPKLFLPIGCILCAIVGMACGSSWTTTATIGLAFLGIGAGLGINPALTAGMIISGAYVGDKFSPLSDTTNLAAAVAETGLFDHVTAMVSSTGPTLVIALILYTIMGLNIDASAYDPTVAQSIQDAFREAFVISPVLLIPIIVVIVMCILRVPGLVGIAISVATATIFMMIFQPTSIYGSRALGDIFNMLHNGIVVETGNEVADSILGKAGGMNGTMWTINLILLALAYGGALERCGCVERLFGGLKHILALRPCAESERDAFAWCNTSGGKRKPRQVTGKFFFAKLFELMDWNIDYRYKLIGKVIHANDEYLIVFDLTASEIYQRIAKDGGKPKTARTPVFPAGWKDQFGLPYREHQKSLQINIFDGYAIYGIKDSTVSSTASVENVTSVQTAYQPEVPVQEGSVNG